jgi:hypothetical protein
MEPGYELLSRGDMYVYTRIERRKITSLWDFIQPIIYFMLRDSLCVVNTLQTYVIGGYRLGIPLAHHKDFIV